MASRTVLVVGASLKLKHWSPISTSPRQAGTWLLVEFEILIYLLSTCLVYKRNIVGEKLDRYYSITFLVCCSLTALAVPHRIPQSLARAGFVYGHGYDSTIRSLTRYSILAN